MSRFSREVLIRLLDALSQDDAFREQFERDPRAALRTLGHETPAADRGAEGRDPVLAFRQLRGGLAGKEQIAARRERIVEAYDAGTQTDARSGGVNPFDCCAEE